MIETMHKLEFASQPENIAIIERLIDEIRDNNAFDDECYGDVLIAMTEAVNNAIVHGNKLQDDKTVVVEYNCRRATSTSKSPTKARALTSKTFPTPPHPRTSKSPMGAVFSSCGASLMSARLTTMVALLS